MKINVNPKAIIRSITEGTVFFIDNFERLAIVIVSRIAPWAAPLAPAYLVAEDDLHFAIILALHYAMLWLMYFFVYDHLVTRLATFQQDGFVYLLRRSDGVFKVGCTIDLPARIEALRQDYGMDFRLVKAWGVEQRYKSEGIALEMTRCFHFDEGNRRELRKMSWLQSRLFIRSFSKNRGNYGIQR